MINPVKLTSILESLRFKGGGNLDPEVKEYVESLRRATEVTINRLVQQINRNPEVENLNMRERRITNVAWPTELHDAVNVEYLEAQVLKKRRPQLRGGGGGGVNEIIFNLGVGGQDVEVANNLAPPRIITEPTGGTLNEWSVIAGVASTGSNLVLRITKNGTAIQTLTYTAGATNIQTTIPTSNTAVDYHDYFNIDVTNVGTGCRRVFVVGRFA